MLVNNVNGEAVGASMVRDSKFYIDLAVFVQAYSIIIKNPNDFLTEIGEKSINEKKDKVTWAQFVKIMQKCDFGFFPVPTETELLVYYNYALEIGSLDSVKQKIATVDEIADAQKHYYNFIDKAKDNAQSEYAKQHKIYLSREDEMQNVDNELSKLKAVIITTYVMMMFSIGIGIFGIFSFFVNNAIVSFFGLFIPVWERQYIGALILILISLAMFWFFNKRYEKYKRRHFKLEKATQTIFTRGSQSYADEIVLKKKLDVLTRDLKTVQAELHDRSKKFDVKENIARLKTTNKYFQKFIENDELMETSKSVGDQKGMRAEDFAPIKLTKDQAENLRRVGKEAINLEGQYDIEAYKEKFEKSRVSKKDKAEEQEKKETENKEQEESKSEKSQEQLENQEKELMESIEYIKEILGFSDEDDLEKSQ